MDKREYLTICNVCNNKEATQESNWLNSKEDEPEIKEYCFMCNTKLIRRSLFEKFRISNNSIWLSVADRELLCMLLKKDNIFPDERKKEIIETLKGNIDWIRH